jgi:TolB-like protein/Tfp pilus assembly protein PilF
MKRCPECRRDYYDNALLYCLDDGAQLLDGPSTASSASPDQPTLLLHRPDPSNAIAVLPFTNLSRSADSEYFSDGVAEELLNVLSKISGLRVAARTSAFAFKARHASIQEIGRALNVGFVLEGSVRTAGERVRITVQLGDVGSGYNLWSETYDRTMDDILVIQDDIARSVVGELRKRLLGNGGEPEGRVADEVAAAMKGRAADPEAHRLMLLGRHLLERGNEAAARKAVEYLQQALEIDPEYARCWGQLARAYYIGSNYGWRSVDSDYAKAEAAMQRALELDPDLAEGLARLGRLRWIRDGDHKGADECLKRAIALEPANIDVLLVAANTANEFGRSQEAIEYTRRAAENDPLSQTAWSASGFSNFLAGNYAEAERHFRRTLELAPQRVSTHALLGFTLLYEGRVEEAQAEARLEPESDLWRPWCLAIVCQQMGDRAGSDAELERLITQFGTTGAFQIAEVHAMRGEADEAFAWLERSHEQRDPGRYVARVSPMLRPLHTDARWQPLLKKMGFPDA